MNKKIFNKNTIEFITVAKEYALFCENAENINTNIIVDNLLKLLPLLYLKASMLPEYNQVIYVENMVDEETYNYIKKNFEKKFGEYDITFPVISNLYQTEETNVESLSELLADIYQDMKDVVVNFQANVADITESSLYNCKRNFENYWGIRLISALNILHILKYSEDINLNDISPKKSNLENIDTSNWIINKFLKNKNEQ